MHQSIMGHIPSVHVVLFSICRICIYTVILGIIVWSAPTYVYLSMGTEDH